MLTHSLMQLDNLLKNTLGSSLTFQGLNAADGSAYLNWNWFRRDAFSDTSLPIYPSLGPPESAKLYIHSSIPSSASKCGLFFLLLKTENINLIYMNTNQNW